jgi:hypothetical protein
MDKPLKLFWNGSRGDNFTTATALGERDAVAAGYSFIRNEGYVYDNQQPNTVPLKLFWSPEREDNFTTATQQGERDAIAAGYAFVRDEGYLYDNQQPNTVPLKLFWGPGRGDNFTTATQQGEADALAVGYSAVRTEGYVAAAPAQAPAAGPQPGTTPEITAQTAEDVGNEKHMRTFARLYRNGNLQINCYTRCTHWGEGLRGRVYVVCVDSNGNQMWVSQVFSCTTRGSRGDLLTSSSGTENFSENMPPEVGKYTVRLDIYQGDAGSRDWTVTRDTTIQGIKTIGAIAAEVKAQWAQLV